MNLNFVLREMTHLRYYAPLILEANTRGISSLFYVTPSNKYNCPFLEKNRNELEDFAKKNQVKILTIDKLKLATDVIITNEKSCLEQIKQVSGPKKVTMTYQTDFVLNYKKFNYYDVYDHILMPSKNIAKFYDLHTDKNLYLGITKYDIVLDKQEIIKKYNLEGDKKKVLFIWPKSRDTHRMPIDIISNFNKLGWQVLVKARGKDPVSSETLKSLTSAGNRVFSDDSWYPHTTQELLEVSNLVVNPGSTTIEECVMHDVPLINFDIKPEIRHGIRMPYRVTHSYLYDYDFCINLESLDTTFSTSKLSDMVDNLQDGDIGSSFERCRESWLYNHRNACKNLLDMLESAC